MDEIKAAIDEVVKVAEEVTVGVPAPELCEVDKAKWTPNGIEWTELCPDCQKKFVQKG